MGHIALLLGKWTTRKLFLIMTAILFGLYASPIVPKSALQLQLPDNSCVCKEVMILQQSGMSFSHFLMNEIF